MIEINGNTLYDFHAGLVYEYRAGAAPAEARVRVYSVHSGHSTFLSFGEEESASLWVTLGSQVE